MLAANVGFDESQMSSSVQRSVLCVRGGCGHDRQIEAAPAGMSTSASSLMLSSAG